MKYDIRKEIKTDYEKTINFIQTAFTTARVTGGEEADMVSDVRNSSRYIPELALVAETDAGELIGYIMLSKTTVDGEHGGFTGLLLAPVCTHEQYRNQGIGGKLIKTALEKAKDLGYTAVFLAGDRNYYNRFGFVPASTYGIRCQHDVPAELMDNIMAVEMIPGALEQVSGTVML